MNILTNNDFNTVPDNLCPYPYGILTLAAPSAKDVQCTEMSMVFKL